MVFNLKSFFTLSLTVIPSILAKSLPEKVYGVNIGSWLVLEPWMLPKEWASMGGEMCDDCTKCIMSERALTKAYPDTADELFQAHWDSWFTAADVAALQDAGINTVRIPLGYWLVEALVDRSSGETFPRNGLKALKRGLRDLKKAGMAVVLDHHAPPGGQAAYQTFAGQCLTDDQVAFYTDYNYARALTWTAVMTALTHLDPDFSDVVAIEAVNEPIMDSSKTPGYGDFQKHFVLTIRAVEAVLGIGLSPFAERSSDTFLSALEIQTQSNSSDVAVTAALSASVDILGDLTSVVTELLGVAWWGSNRQPLTTAFMDMSWQWNSPANPADAAIGPALYDNHLYYGYGVATSEDPEAYLTHNCNLDRVERDLLVNNTPLVFGGTLSLKWGLMTSFNATDDFLLKWADSQKLQYGKGRGWFYWNFKTEPAVARQWSYLEGVARGYLTKDPAQFHDPDVCKPYINTTASSS
ncbi:glycoside hydrolase family 5 protein [Cylindrobasidium torrendii FP15055 ss-10]|uniref:Glycoside hydrolase family 5 protein n=1 Tax=Cylindrobasidium torrendii FP15055 ss-10 TaxID=1314674 RepID=A0A0D7B1F1_9AGAR|nr:glycoside hydrolase family 5 protein [Cylindrobasidium torrendii FP15055 ss-10]